MRNPQSPARSLNPGYMRRSTHPSLNPGYRLFHENEVEILIRQRAVPHLADRAASAACTRSRPSRASAR
jgi:hypothetical protein